MWRKTLILTLTLALTALLLSACARSAEQTASIAEAPSGLSIAPSLESQDAYYAPPGETGRATTNTALVDGAEQLIIRTGDLSLVVSNTETTLADIIRLAESNGGWVVNSSLYQYDSRAKSGSVVIRIPADGFNSAMAAIKALALEVTSESSSGQDVTEEYVDLAARLGNLEATAARVRGFLDDANKVEDALAVNQELSRLEGEIESIKGRMQYLSQSAAFSTISINLTPDILAQPIEVAGWRPQGVARDAVASLIEILQGLGTVLIWAAIVLLPLALVFGLPAWLIIRRARRGRQGA